jgi:hypothetical protein
MLQERVAGRGLQFVVVRRPLAVCARPFHTRVYRRSLAHWLPSFPRPMCVSTPSAIVRPALVCRIWSRSLVARLMSVPARPYDPATVHPVLVRRIWSRSSAGGRMSLLLRSCLAPLARVVWAVWHCLQASVAVGVPMHLLRCCRSCVCAKVGCSRIFVCEEGSHALSDLDSPGSVEALARRRLG